MQKIVVVGGGAGGLELVSRLSRTLGRKNEAEITLVDRSRTHIWKPLLHEVAAGVIDKHSDGVDYAIHAAAHHYRFQLGSMCAIDAEAKTITLAPLFDDEGVSILPERKIPYDQLVLAIGSVSNDFGTPGVAQNCYFLDSLVQAERFHTAVPRLCGYLRRPSLQRSESRPLHGRNFPVPFWHNVRRRRPRHMPRACGALSLSII